MKKNGNLVPGRSSLESIPDPKDDDDSITAYSKTEAKTEALNLTVKQRRLTSIPPPKDDDDTVAMKIPQESRTEDDDGSWIQRLFLAVVAAATNLLRRRHGTR